MEYKVSWEIDIDAESPLDAAKKAQEMMHDPVDWQFYVQSWEAKEIFSVDLQEEDEDAVLPVDHYEPNIKNV